MAELIKVNAPVRKPLFEGVQGENEARSIQFDIEPWVTELGDGAVTATAKRSQDSQPYPVTVTRDGTTVTWKPTSTDTAFAGVGSFQLEYTVDSVLAKTCIWSTMVAPSLDPAGDPPDPYDNWLAEMREIAADAIQAAQDADASADDAQAEVYEAEAWAKGTKNGTPVPSTADQYENNAKYWAEQSLANQYGAYIVKSASGDIASFNDGADDVPMKSLKVAITPKQSGNGDPSPSNVRPITGTSTVNISLSPYEQTEKHTITGKNLYNAPNDQMNVLVPCHIASGTQVTISASSSSVPGFRYYDANKQQIDYWTLSSTASDGRRYRAFTTTGACEYVEFYGVLGTDFMVETGVAVPSPYEPYGVGTPVPLGQTVYGGELDVDTGVLTIDRAFYDLTSKPFDVIGDGAYFAWVDSSIPFALNHEPESGILSHFKYGDLEDCVVGSNAQQGHYVLFFKSKMSSRYGISTLADFTAFLQTQSNNGTPVQICYKLKTPTTVQLTPAQVASLLGDNNVWADCGAVEVEYRADPTLAYAELEALILENI